MQRRKYLATIGSLAAGGAAAMGTGAFSQTSATRSVSVSAAGDAAANLKLTGSKYASYNGNGVLEIEFDGLNANADIEITDVFGIKNQGTDPVGIFIDEGSQSYAFQQGNGPAEVASKAGSDGMYNVLADAGLNQNGWYDDDNDTEDINGPKALPSAYRSSSSNGTNRPSLDPGSYDHVLDVGESLSPDWYLFDTPADPSDLDITGKIVVLAYSQDYVDAGKGP
ncbi:hypothetical protein SAMN04488063_3533 [Halopelagius inordinatus]|uniref:Uncharacterized protein n=1 Tax=Halopelagius inordinatus TaxID=553467 RepID=A0A1I2WF64_9EURY|nr:hypothetical protein [Halopelagius inordinatus]SFG99954.1 hypothetical protein SAMN04488063_3533 [Halopelagius inordinatus]